MLAKLDRSDHASIPNDTECVKEGSMNRAGFADLRPQRLIQRQCDLVANTSSQVQKQREISNIIQRMTGEAPAENRTGLPDRLKAGIESLSGIGMDNVRVHYNSSKPAQLNAHAYAQGMDIHIAPGQEKHLPHEAWHVVQQAQGRVGPTFQTPSGIPVNTESSLEIEADVMGAQAVKTVAQARAFDGHAVGSAKSAVIQRYKSSFVPDLQGLKVPSGPLDYRPYDASTFERPSGWYEGTFDALAERGMSYVAELGPPINKPVVLYRCERTKTNWVTYEGIDAGHKENWKPYLARAMPETVREAVSAYNDLANLQIESATVNRSHDFETDANGNYKMESAEQKMVEEEFSATGNHVDLNSYDMTDPMIDNSTDEVEEVILVVKDDIHLTDEGGMKSRASFEKISGTTVVKLTGRTEGRYVEVEIIKCENEGANIEGQILWANSREIKHGNVTVF